MTAADERTAGGAEDFTLNRRWLRPFTLLHAGALESGFSALTHRFPHPVAAALVKLSRAQVELTELAGRIVDEAQTIANEALASPSA